jgi:hypothetical protein
MKTKTRSKKTRKPLQRKETVLEEIERAAVDLGGSEGASNLSARVVLAAFHVGPSVQRISKFLGVPAKDIKIQRISKFLGVPAKDIKIYADRLKRNGCWKNGKVAVTNVNDGDSLYMDACLMGAVAMGWVESVNEQG